MNTESGNSSIQQVSGCQTVDKGGCCKSNGFFREFTSETAAARYEGYMLNTCEQAKAFIQDVGSTHVKIMLDTFHMNIEEDNIATAIRRAGTDLCHLHLGEQNRRVPGKGSLPWTEIGQALRDINYQGAAVMEPFVMSGGTIGSEIKVWRDLVPGATEEKLDEDARGAVQFVRHVFEG